ncbi:MAG: EsaB/YukD family protein [Pseudoclavibacter sp.]
MSTIGGTAAAPGRSATVTVTCGDRGLDLSLPLDVAVVELLPVLARRLGVLDPTLAHGGYSLARSDGRMLRDDVPLAPQRVADGDQLHLLVGALSPDQVVYDDVVEAIGDAVERSQRSWTATDDANMALACCLGLMLLAAVALALLPPSLLVAAVAFGAAAVAMTVAGVLSAQRQPAAALGISLVASLLASVGGFQGMRAVLAPSGPALLGWPLAAAGLGMALFGAVGVLVASGRRIFAAMPVLAGALIVVPAVVAALVRPGAVWPIGLAVVAVAANGIPWVSLTSARITVQSAQTEQEIFAPPVGIDSADVERRYRAGMRLLLALRLSCLVVLCVAAVPTAMAPSPAGAGACALAFLGMMLTTRQCYARVEVLLLMGGGLGGLVLTAVVTAAAHPDWRVALAALAGAAAVAVAALTLLTAQQTVRLARIADWCALACLALVLPLAAVAAGIV